jgi:ABC-type branched-subunit amino acid transport system ATPase component
MSEQNGHQPDRVDGVLSIKNLTAGYGKVPVVEGVNMTAHAGQVTVLVGLNGAGKSTLLKAIAGVIKSSSGQVILDGADVSGKVPEALLRCGIAYVPQVANVFPSLTVHENLKMGGYILRSGLQEKVDEVCELFPDLKSALKRKAKTLSGGQRHMLAVARGLMVKPLALLLDEPTAGLSPKFEEALWERVLAIKATGTALVVVDQNVRRALGHADWGYVMALGRNLASGPGKDLVQSDEVGNLYAATT